MKLKTLSKVTRILTWTGLFLAAITLFFLVCQYYSPDPSNVKAIKILAIIISYIVIWLNGVRTAMSVWYEQISLWRK